MKSSASKSRAVLCRARCAPLATAVLLALGTTAALGQTVTGGIYGQAPKGETVVIKSVNTGLVRAVQPRANGKFSVTPLNPGEYHVEVMKGTRVVSQSIVTVRAGLMSPATNAVAVSSAKAAAPTLGTINVTANRAAATFTVNPIDTQTPELISHYSMKLINDLPTNRSPESIALLQSSVTFDRQTTGSVELNGASAGGSRYYLNGFDVTNNGSNIGSFIIPAEAIAGTSIINGNFNASFTDATGGALASTVKHGSNQFSGGYDLYFTPPTSRLFRPLGGNTVNSIGKPFQYVSSANHAAPVITQDYWVSGPIIKNHLFGYVLFNQSLPRTSTGFGATSRTQSNGSDRDGLVNLTWDINSNQTLDVLAVHDTNKGFSSHNRLTKQFDPSSIGAFTGWNQSRSATQYYIGDYTINVGENFQASFMAGRATITDTALTSAEQAAEQSGGGQLPPCAVSVDPVTQIGTLLSPSDFCTVSSPTNQKTTGYKADFTWWLGPNKIQFGAQYYNVEFESGFQTVPAGDWTYLDIPGSVLQNGFVVSPTNGHYVSQFVDNQTELGNSHRKSAYLQDSWQATDRLLLYGGVRWTSATYFNSFNQPIATTPTFSPRVGFAWDVDGNSSFKIGGGIGRYTVVFPASFNGNGGKSRTLLTNYFTYTGIQRDGAPIGLSPIGPPVVQQNGVPLTADQLATRNLKAPEEVSWQLYAQKMLPDAWMAHAIIGGTRYYRTIDETCDEDAIVDYAHVNGFPNYEFPAGRNPCYEVNPGEPVVLVRHFASVLNDQLQQLNIPASVVGIPHPEKHYYHLTIGATHTPTPSAPYFLDLSYTFARAYGNEDGLFDLSRRFDGYPGRSIAFAFPVLQEGANGNLAEDIRNTFVASGVYYFNHGRLNGLHAGGIFRINSGAPWSCLGTFPDPTSQATIRFHNSSYYCRGVVTPQGSFRLPWVWTLGLDVGYDWKINGKNRLSVDLKVENVTNRQGVIDRAERVDTGAFLTPTTLQPNVSFGAETLQAPRFTQLVIRYQFN